MANTTPNISRRYGIAWSDTPITTDPKYSEPTSTLVLSSPSGQFVDLRLYLKTPAKDPAATPTSIELGIHYSSLEWAIAGQSSYSTTPEGKKHGKWTHWVSSRSSGNGDVDEGDMETGADGRIVETGEMVNPDEGRKMWYAEVWGDVTQKMPPPVPGAAVAGEPNRWTVGGQGERQHVAELEKGKRSYVVVRCEHQERHVRGLIIWVGQYCQGVLKEGDKITAERWEYDFVPNKGKGEWVRTFRIGDGSLPCGWLVKESDGIRRGETLCAPKLLGDRDRWVITDEDFTV
jgi:hypothetical protein